MTRTPGAALRRTLVLWVMVLLTVALLAVAEGDPGAPVFAPQLIKGNTCCGVPSNGQHNPPGDHCPNGTGNDANTNKHCLAANASG